MDICSLFYYLPTSSLQETIEDLKYPPNRSEGPMDRLVITSLVITHCIIRDTWLYGDNEGEVLGVVEKPGRHWLHLCSCTEDWLILPPGDPREAKGKGKNPAAKGTHVPIPWQLFLDLPLGIQ